MNAKKNVKKVLVVALVIALAALACVLCTSCSKPAETKAEEAKIAVKIVNKTGEEVTEVRMAERAGDKNQVWTGGPIEDGGEVVLTINTVLDNGAPNVEFAFTTKSVQGCHTSIETKGDKTVTLVADPEGGVRADIETSN